MYWQPDSILNKYNKRTPTKEIFQAVCDALGEVYSRQGFTYSRSGRKLTLIKDDLKLDISFYSSRNNEAGEWVDLEILPVLYSRNLIRNKEKGILLSHVSFFSKKLTGDSQTGTLIVRKINGEESKNRRENFPESVFQFSNNVNIYGLKEEGFLKIVAFINHQVIEFSQFLAAPETMLETLGECSWKARKTLERSAFLEYVGSINPALMKKAQGLILETG
jgi:hypothetical protein